MLTTEWKLEDALAVRYEEGREEGLEEGRDEVLALLKSGKSPEEIIREYGTRTVTARPASGPGAQA